MQKATRLKKLCLQGSGWCINSKKSKQLSSFIFDLMTTKVKRSLSEREGEILTPNKTWNSQSKS